jgi:hypothetical protein
MSNLIPTPDSPALAVAILGPEAEPLAQLLRVDQVSLERAQVAILVVSAISGFTPEVTQAWDFSRDHYIPTIVAITDLDNSEIDFEDMAAIVTKSFEPVLTPYLVLHSDQGFPTALIGLETLRITDYSLGLMSQRDSDPEHKELVADFREEYLETIEIAGEGAFLEGLLFPAIPLYLAIKMGVSEIANFLTQIPSRS